MWKERKSVMTSIKWVGFLEQWQESLWIIVWVKTLAIKNLNNVNFSGIIN